MCGCLFPGSSAVLGFIEPLVYEPYTKFEVRVLHNMVSKFQNPLPPGANKTYFGCGPSL